MKEREANTRVEEETKLQVIKEEPKGEDELAGDDGDEDERQRLAMSGSINHEDDDIVDVTFNKGANDTTLKESSPNDFTFMKS